MPLERVVRRTRRIVIATTSVSVAALALASFALVRQSQADAVRAADRKAAAVSQVTGCYQQVDNAPKVLRILGLVDILASNSITANREALASSSPNDPLTHVREASLDRLVPARNDLRSFIATTEKQAPTDATCRKLALSLGVNPNRPKGTS